MVLPLPPPPMDPMMGDPMMGPPPGAMPMGPPPGMPMDPMMGMPPPMDPAMMGMDPMMGMMPPQGLPGFPPGVMPDPNYPGSQPVIDAEMMLAMQDPEVAEALVRLYLQEMDPDPGPKYKKWYDKDDYPKPKGVAIIAKAHDDRSDYTLLVERMRRDRDRIRMAGVGVFKDHDPEMSLSQRDSSLALDVQLITSILAAADLLFNKTTMKAGQEEDAQKVENFCYAAEHQAGMRHNRIHGTSYAVDRIKNSLYTGHLVTRVLPNYDAEEGEIPTVRDLLDPASCFPSYDGYGIRTMTRTYHQTCQEVFSGFRLDKKKRKTILSKRQKDKNGIERDRTLNDSVEVIEYWDRRYYGVAVDSELVIGPTEHYFGMVPFAYTRSGTGDAGNTFEQNLNGTLSTGSLVSRQIDLANKGQSHIQYIQTTHEQKEAILGLVATELAKVANPPRTFEQDMSIYGDSPQVANGPGTISLLQRGLENEVPNTPDSRLQLLGPALAAANEASQRGMMAPSDYGLTPGSQSSGAVVEGLSEASKDKLNLWKLMIEEHESAVNELDLTLNRDHGRTLGPEGDRGTTLMIEKQHPTEGEDGYFEFDYRQLRTDTCRVKTRMTSLRMQNLGALGNSVSMWTNMGLMDKHDALELRGVRDPQAYLRRIDIQAFKDTPEYKTAKLLEWMKIEKEDPETMATVMYLLATKGGGGGQQQPPMGGPGPMPGNGGGPPTVGMPGAPGQQGGPPMQLPGPPPSLEGQGMPPGIM